METTFPQFRKYVSGSSYFKIEGPKAFVEVQLIGSKALVHHIEAKAYPEQLRIMDMLACEGGHWEPVEQAEFERVLSAAS